MLPKLFDAEAMTVVMNIRQFKIMDSNTDGIDVVILVDAIQLTYGERLIAGACSEAFSEHSLDFVCNKGYGLVKY